MSTDNTESEDDKKPETDPESGEPSQDSPDFDAGASDDEERPEIEKEPIDDPEALEALMEGGSVEDSHAPDAEPSALDIDALLLGTDTDAADAAKAIADEATSVADTPGAPVPEDEAHAEPVAPVTEDPAEVVEEKPAEVAAESGMPSEETPPAEPEQRTYSLTDIDALLLDDAEYFESPENKIEPVPEEIADEAPAAEENEETAAAPSGITDIDALLLGDGMLDEDDDDDGSPSDDQFEAMIEDELKTLASADDDSLLNAGDSQDVLDEKDMDERLDGTTEDSLATSLPEQLDADMAVVPDEKPAPAVAPEPSAETTPAEDVSDETLQEVVDENISAAAELDTPEVDEEDAYEPVKSEEDREPEREYESEDEYVRPYVARRRMMDELRKVPPVVIEMVRDEPYRAITAFAAGLIAMLSGYLILTANEYRPVSEYATVVLDEGSALRRAITTAEMLIEDGEYVEAAMTIEKALLDANPKSPIYLDAEYLELEAEIRALGDTVSTRVANRLHGKIDRMVTEQPLHPKRPEGLYWKAQLYEKEGNLQAARVEYRELLKNEWQAENLNRVLLALGELELRTDRPLNAAEYLQDLRRRYPGTTEAARARLLLGDALVAAGDPEAARVTYINVAENDPAGQLGADAFSRLGELAFETGNYEQAIRELEGRLSRSSTVEGNDGVTLLLAKTYRAVGRYEDAKNLLQGLIDFFPESDVTPLAQIELSQVMNDMGMGREAVRFATQTTQVYPDHPDVLRNAGELLALHGDAVDAGRALLAAHTAGTGDPELLLSAGRLFVKAGQKSRAEQVFRQLADDYSRSRQGLLGHVELAKLLFERGEVSDALERLENLNRTTNSSGRKLPVLAALGEIYGTMGLNGKVAEVYSEAASISDDPEVIAESAIALFDIGAIDQGLTVASNVNAQQLEEDSAYDFLNALGRGTMRRDAQEGLGYLEQAHASYPEARTASGVQALLEANLSLGRSARARAIISELNNRLSEREHALERPRLEQAAITYGNFLFNRGDYRAAADAYSMALDSQIVGTTEDVPDMALTDRQLWSLYQLANTKFKLSDYAASIPLYERVASSSSEWADEASTKLQSARLEQRLRGRARSEARNAG